MKLKVMLSIMLYKKNEIYYIYIKNYINMSLKICNRIILSQSDSHVSMAFTDNDESTEYIYQGEYHNEMLNGYGKLSFNGNNYAGFFRDNNFDGKGILNIKNYEDDVDNYFVKSYDGIFRSGKKEGIGLEKYKNNEYYIGEFVKDLRHGKGTLYNENGAIKIDSNWECGSSIDSKSITEYWENGKLKYKGEYNGTSYNGKGVFVDKESDLMFDGKFNLNKFTEGKLISDKGIKMFEGSFSFDNLSWTCPFPTKGKIFDKDCNEIIDSEYIFSGIDSESISLKISNCNEYYINKNLKFKGKICESNRISKNITSEIEYELDINLKSKYFYGKSLLVKGFFQNGFSYFENGERELEINLDENLSGYISKNNNNGEEILRLEIKYNRLHGKCKKYMNGLNNKSVKITSYNMNKKTEEELYLNEQLIVAFTFSETSNLIDIKSYHQNGNIKYDGKGMTNTNNPKSYCYEGPGKFYYPDNNINYEGNFINDRFDGSGTFYYVNGFKSYEGNYSNGKRNGSGISYYETSGSKEYEGNWSENEKHGQGSLFSEEGDLVFSGTFHWDEMQFS